MMPARSVALALTLAILAAAVATVGAVEAPLPRPAASSDCQLPTADCQPKAPDRLAPAAARVIDGDTIEVAGETIRLLDIDTPELKGACDAERRLARLAAARLAVLLETRPWRIERAARRDRYGRTLALITTEEAGVPVSLGTILVAEGYAAPWEGRRHDWCGAGR